MVNLFFYVRDVTNEPPQNPTKRKALTKNELQIGDTLTGAAQKAGATGEGEEG